jgi:probable F420-dependent oxidoreductase
MTRISPGPFGVWATRAALDPSRAAQLEGLGYGALWIGGSPGPDLGDAEAALDASTDIVVATGIVPIWAAPASELAASYARIESRHPGRFLLGIGTSHPERWGQEAAKPYDALAAYVDELADAGVPRDRIVLAALGPRVVRLSGEHAGGAHPYLVTPEHTREARDILGAGPLLATEQHAVLDTDRERGLAIARKDVAGYLKLINYRRNLLRLGFTEAELDDGGSDDVIDALVAIGDEQVIADRLRAHQDAGADHVCVRLLEDVPDGYARIAAALA